MINQVRIGSVPYQIQFESPLVSDERDKILWGEILQEKQLIRADADLAPEMKRVVIVHEIIHGLLNHAGLDGHDEELPKRLGYALDTFLVDNPQFVALYRPETAVSGRPIVLAKTCAHCAANVDEEHYYKYGYYFCGEKHYAEWITARRAEES